MGDQREVKLFRNGRNQAVRVPRDWELPGDTAILRRDGDNLILEPRKATGLIAVLESLDTLDIQWPESDDDLGRLDEPVLD